jgi:hypothetical protein
MYPTDHPPRAGRIRTAWTAAHTAVPGVPRWARVGALAVPFTVLPASLWRIAICTFHLPLTRMTGDVVDSSSGLPGLPLAVYVVLLSIVSELVAFTAVGLVARWGEVFPRWVPVLGGRSVPARGVVALGGGAATVLTLLWTWTAVTVSSGRRVDGSRATGPRPLEFEHWQGWLAVVAYAPLLLWGPLLGAVTVHYGRRRSVRSADANIRSGRFGSTRTMAR